MRKLLSATVAVACMLSIGAPARASTPYCYGNPPRQTPDPLSPPCVPFFDGDNGGATYSGVTKDIIKVAFYNDLGVSGDMTAPWQPSDEASPVTPENENLVHTIKARLAYYSAHYQTYGRVVDVIATRSSLGADEGCAIRRQDALALIRSGIFAVLAFGDDMECFAQAMATSKVPVFLFGTDVSATTLETMMPYVWSFLPEQETEAAYSASFICRSLQHQRARLSRDPSLQSMVRTFGLIRPKPTRKLIGATGASDRLSSLAKLLREDVLKECGMTFASVDTYSAKNISQPVNLMTKYRTLGITTVVCYCDPATAMQMQSSATKLAYLPEWYWDHASRMDRPMDQLQYGDPLQTSFGVSYFWPLPSVDSQYATRAFSEQAPDATPNGRYDFDIYHLFLNLFQGIQSAGPNLTPETVQRGMFTFAFTDRTDTLEPIGGYGPYDSMAVGDYSFIDTGMAWWWDPLGTPPGGMPSSGCERVASNGARSYAGAWPTNDSALFAATDPCTGAPQS